MPEINSYNVLDDSKININKINSNNLNTNQANAAQTNSPQINTSQPNSTQTNNPQIQTQNQSPQQEQTTAQPEHEDIEQMRRIISELRKRMVEIDEIAQRMKAQERNTTETKKMIEEIKVPALELLK
jgi:hypothetical protein